MSRPEAEGVTERETQPFAFAFVTPRYDRKSRFPSGSFCPIDGMTNPCSVDDLPTPFVPTNEDESRYQCLSKGTQYYFGQLVEPWIDAKGRGPHFMPSEKGECYTNSRPLGSTLYQRFADYYGPMYDIQTGNPHQGYGDAGQDPAPEFFGRGSLFIHLPTARVWDSTRNCTKGFFM